MPSAGVAVTRTLGVPAWAVPAAELLEVEVRASLHRADEVLAGRRLAVMAFEIQVGALPEPFRPAMLRIMRMTSAPLLYTVAV
jgi:hypothetical protein